MEKTGHPGGESPTKPITIRMPVDVVENLKRIAPLKGLSGYQALIKLYVGQCLRQDLENLWEEERFKKLESAFEEFGLNDEQKGRIRDLLRDHPLMNNA